MTFTYIDLFSGIGGFRQALDKLGGECVFSSEKDKHAYLAYSTLYGDSGLHGDITKIHEKDVPDHDVLVAGKPCQSFSIAGKRKGFEDIRGTLFFEIARLVKEKRPKLILLENVKGLINHDKGTTLEVILETLSELGYLSDFALINSKFYHAPQNRERVYIIAVRENLIEQEDWIIPSGNTVDMKAKRKHSENKNIKTFNFDYPSNSSVTVKLKDILEDDVSELYLDDVHVAELVGQMNNPPTDNAYEVRPILTPERLNKRQNGRRFKENDEEAFTVNTLDRHGVAIGQYPDYKIRKFTVLESFRLQGFSDEDCQKLKDIGISESQLYKLTGNAVTVNVVYEIGKELVKMLEGISSIE